jgi:hypothetical protein
MKRPIRILLCCALLMSLTEELHAQDTLPSFSAIIRSGKVIISWTNPYDSIVQISIQRSPDSLRGYKTIITIPDPKTTVNGYLDRSAPDTAQFYRMYVQLQRGHYFQTKPKRPFRDTTRTFKFELARNERSGIRYITGLPAEDTGKLQMQLPTNLFKPSVFVYTNPEGNVEMAFPDIEKQTYRIQFLLPDGGPFFQVKNVKEQRLVLDRSNFLRSGWFEFEVYENEKLREKGKLFIPKQRR